MKAKIFFTTSFPAFSRLLTAFLETEIKVVHLVDHKTKISRVVMELVNNKKLDQIQLMRKFQAT